LTGQLVKLGGHLVVSGGQLVSLEGHCVVTGGQTVGCTAPAAVASWIGAAGPACFSACSVASS